MLKWHVGSLFLLVLGGAVFVSASSRTWATEPEAAPRSGTSCLVDVPDCPRDVSYQTPYFDSYNNSASDPSACSRRAYNQRDWCQSRKPTTARFIRDGEVSQTTVASPLVGSCVVSIQQCPKMPSLVGTNYDTSSGAADSSSACYTRASDQRDWCGAEKSITAQFKNGGAVVGTKEATPNGCLVQIPECPRSPSVAATYYDTYNGAATDATACMARAYNQRDWCRSTLPVRASYFSAGTLAHSVVADGVARSSASLLELPSRVLAPISQKQYFQEEPDLFAYKPGFEPNAVGFDPSNRPFLRTVSGGILRLNTAGTWEKVDLIAQIDSSLASQGITWDRKFASARDHEDRVVFDQAGDAYTLLDTTSATFKSAANPNGFHVGVLLHSRDRGTTWRAYLLNDFVPGTAAKLEFQDGNNQIPGPPPLLIFGVGSYLIDTSTNLATSGGAPNPYWTTANLYIPKKKSDGTLDLGSRLLVSQRSLLATAHSGAANVMVSSGDFVHIAYPALNDTPGVPCSKGTPTYTRTYRRSTAILSPPLFVGCAGSNNTNVSSPDNHDQPGITIDSFGYLHLLLGAHHGQFLYRKALRPNDSTVWSPGILIGEPKADNEGSYTYIGLICDKKNVLHVVSRWAGAGYYFRLVYLRKSASGDPQAKWDSFVDPVTNKAYSHQYLLVPFRAFYTVYHHKLDLDRYGRLFMSYETWGQDFTGTEMAEYCKKWSSECAPYGGILPPDPGYSGCLEPTTRCFYQNSSKPHSPAMMVSLDGGTSWSLVSTQDFQAGWTGP